jgi:hypothetical protein
MAANPSLGTTSVRSREFDLFRSFRTRALSSIAATGGWFSLTLLYVAFWAHGFAFFQSVVVVVVSLLVLGSFLVGAWLSFGHRFAGQWSD